MNIGLSNVEWFIYGVLSNTTELGFSWVRRDANSVGNSLIKFGFANTLKSFVYCNNFFFPP